MQYPLVIETGESFLSHRTLLRFIRDKCGDAVAEYLAQFIGEDAEILKNAELLKRVKEHLDSIASNMDEMDAELGSALSLMEKAGVE